MNYAHSPIFFLIFLKERPDRASLLKFVRKSFICSFWSFYCRNICRLPSSLRFWSASVPSYFSSRFFERAQQALSLLFFFSVRDMQFDVALRLPAYRT